MDLFCVNTWCFLSWFKGKLTSPLLYNYTAITLIRIAYSLYLPARELITRNYRDVRPFLLFPAYWFIVIPSRTTLELSVFFLNYRLITWRCTTRAFLATLAESLINGWCTSCWFTKAARRILIGAILWDIFLRRLPYREWLDYVRDLCKKYRRASN